MQSRSRPNRHDRDEKNSGGQPVWLTTFADMNMLLLCFFVFLVAVMDPSPKLKEALEHIQLNISKEPLPTRAHHAFVPTLYAGVIEDSTIREESIDRRVARLDRDEGVRDTNIKPIRFEPGSIKLSEAARSELATIADDDLKGYSNLIEIRGHAAVGESDDPWTLAWKRALVVGRYLMDQEKIEPIRLRLSSSGDVDLEGAGADGRVDLVPTGGFRD